MIKDLKEAFELENLHRAWKWLNTNSDGFYKGYFRHIYRAYAISIDRNLLDLRSRLVKGIYQPAQATKIYLPKKSGLQRTYTLLTVEDQIIYQAFTNVVSERLFPVVRHRYLKETYGNLYAGHKSLFFYKDWRKCYKKFGNNLRKIYSKGFIYTASFDLTACYDSIDHSVLEYFLCDLGLNMEFVRQLREYLKFWSANPNSNNIYHGHGIPQGPLSSGLISEVVLRFFDENRPKKPREWRYFRYVDDIRFFARNEIDLRAMIVEMDLLSKQIGLFPQSGKIAIHKVTNIEDEIKSISNPPEPVVSKKSPNQKKVFERIKELTPRNMVTSETRFKYVLGSAEPSAKLSSRLISVLNKQPHLYVSIFNYFGRYRKISRKISAELLGYLKQNDLYMALNALGLRILRDRCHPDLQKSLEDYARNVIDDSEDNLSPELRAAAVGILLSSGRMLWVETCKNFSDKHIWWYRAELMQYVRQDLIGTPSYQALLNNQLVSDSVDVSVVAVEILVVNGLKLTQPIEAVNPIAQQTLKTLGVLKQRRGRLCPISKVFREIFGNSLVDVEWKKLLDKHYTHDIPKAIRLRAYYETDATSWVNLLDTIHDDLLDSLFRHELGAVGSYTHGNIGSVFSSPMSKFGLKYPITYKLFDEIHKKRLESSLSHSVVKHTGKRTKFIEYSYIQKISMKLWKAYLEIWNNW